MILILLKRYIMAISIMISFDYIINTIYNFWTARLSESYISQRDYYKRSKGVIRTTNLVSIFPWKTKKKSLKTTIETKRNYHWTYLLSLTHSYLKCKPTCHSPDLFSPISECQTLRAIVGCQSMKSVEAEKLDIWHFNILEQVIYLFNQYKRKISMRRSRYALWH